VESSIIVAVAQYSAQICEHKITGGSAFFNFSKMKSIAIGVSLGVPDALSLTSCTTSFLCRRTGKTVQVAQEIRSSQI